MKRQSLRARNAAANLTRVNWKFDKFRQISGEHYIPPPADLWSLETSISRRYTRVTLQLVHADYTVGHKNGATFIFTITLANVDRFQ